MKISSKSTTATTALLLIIGFLNIILGTEKVAARPDKCEQIRQVRRLAFQENLDGSNLASLERIFCGGNRDNRSHNSEINFPPNNASTDCVKLTAMKRFAQLTKNNSNLIRIIRGQQRINCQFAQKDSSVSWNWSNGEEAKWGSTWYYPNGQKAAERNSDWYYPNGQHAKWGSTWYYPNGQHAKSHNLMGWACGIVSRKQCMQAATRVQQTKGFWQEIEILELSWQAYQMNQSRP